MSKAGKSASAPTPAATENAQAIKNSVHALHGASPHALGYKRHGKSHIRDRPAVNNPSLRRLARRGGVKRISSEIYPVARDALYLFLQPLVCDAITFSEHCRRKTVTTIDVLEALKRRGATIYGAPSYTVRHHREHPAPKVHKSSKSAPAAAEPEDEEEEAAGEEQEGGEGDKRGTGPPLPEDQDFETPAANTSTTTTTTATVADEPAKKGKKSTKASKKSKTPETPTDSAPATEANGEDVDMEDVPVRRRRS